jgi:hypothetical protein
MIRIRHGSSREQAHAFFDICRKQVKAAGLDPAETFFVFPFGGFGEFTYICSLLSEMRKEGKVALFLPENKIDFLEIFPKSADFFVRYSPQFISYIPELFLQGMRKPGYPFVPFTDFLGDGRFNVELVAREGRLTLKEGYAFLMGLPLETIGSAASVPDCALPSQIDTKAPEKRILIIPHANSHKPFGVLTWENLTQRFKKLNYSVFFETTSYKQEVPIDVKSISLTPKQLLKSLPSFDGVVTIRSGLADLMGSLQANQRCKLAVVYHITENPLSEEQRFNHTSGVTAKGLALSRIYHNETGIRDFEINGDQLEPLEIDKVVNYLVGQRSR